MNIRKKLKVILPILLVLILVILCIVDKQLIFDKIFKKRDFAKELIEVSEANANDVFRVTKVIKYSSVEAIDNTEEQNLQDISISQYSDIAVYIDNTNEELTEENTIKELYLDNFKIDVDYENGKSGVYYKNPLEISKYRLIETNKIKDRLDYEIIYTNDKNTKSIYSKPVFYTDCSNPITIGYVNQNIVNNYAVTPDNGVIDFDGRILKNVDIDLKKLSPKISFTIHIKNNLNEEFACDMSVKLDMETDKGTIKSGYIVQIMDEIGYYKFFKNGE